MGSIFSTRDKDEGKFPSTCDAELKQPEIEAFYTSSRLDTKTTSCTQDPQASPHIHSGNTLDLLEYEAFALQPTYLPLTSIGQHDYLALQPRVYDLSKNLVVISYNHTIHHGFTIVPDDHKSQHAAGKLLGSFANEHRSGTSTPSCSATEHTKNFRILSSPYDLVVPYAGSPACNEPGAQLSLYTNHDVLSAAATIPDDTSLLRSPYHHVRHTIPVNSSTCRPSCEVTTTLDLVKSYATTSADIDTPALPTHGHSVSSALGADPHHHLAYEFTQSIMRSSCPSTLTIDIPTLNLYPEIEQTQAAQTSKQEVESMDKIDTTITDHAADRRQVG